MTEAENFQAEQGEVPANRSLGSTLQQGQAALARVCLADRECGDGFPEGMLDECGRALGGETLFWGIVC